MPTYMQQISSGYRYRRIVPTELRPILGQTAIIVSLGKNYTAACRRAREEAVRSDQRFDAAKDILEQRGTSGTNFYNSLTPITELTEELKQQLHAYWLSVVDVADQERRAAPKTDDAEEEKAIFRSEAQSMLEFLKAAWRDGNIDPLLPALHTTLMTRGYRLELPLEDQRRLCLQFLRAALAGYKLLEARDMGEDPALNLPAQPLPLAKPSTTTKTKNHAKPNGGDKELTLYSLFEYWRDSGVARAQKTVDDVERRIHQLDELTKHKPADQLTKADFIRYRDERIKTGLALRTVEKDLSFIKAVMQFAFDSDKLTSNPAAGIKVPKDPMPSPQRDLAVEDLKILFTSPIYTQGERPQGGSHDAAAWLPLIALYTGAREEELCQLTLDDIKTNAPIPYIKIIDLIDEKQDKQIKRLKNKGSRREIPIPKQLIAHGFLRYVEHLRKNSETWLFPKLTVEPKYGRRSANWCKWWGRWRKKLGVVGKEKCFHAFRHVFKTACRTAGIGEDIHDAITGHKEAHEGRNYGKFPLQALHGPLNKVAYPELNIDWVWQPSTPAPTRRRNPTKKSPVAPHAEPSAKSTKTAPRRRTPDFAQTGSTPSSADAPQRTPADD